MFKENLWTDVEIDQGSFGSAVLGEGSEAMMDLFMLKGIIDAI